MTMTFKANNTFDGEERPNYTQEELKEQRKRLLRQRSRANHKIRTIIDIELDYLDRLIE